MPEFFGIIVNDLYDHDSIEDSHEIFFVRGRTIRAFPRRRRADAEDLLETARPFRATKPIPPPS